MYSKIRKFLRENREKPIIGLVYRRLKIREKKRLLRIRKVEVSVDVEGTERLYLREADRLRLGYEYIRSKTVDTRSKQ